MAKWYQIANSAVAERGTENVRHADRERRCAAGAAVKRRLAHAVGERLHLRRIDGKSPGRDRGRRRRRVRAHDAGRGVDREVDAGIQHAGGDQRHDRDEGLERHRSIADHAHIGLARDQLGRRAGGNERVKARDRAAGERDEQERKQLAAEDRARAVDEPGEGGHPDVRLQDADRDREQEDDAELDEGGEVVTRREQQPDRQDRGDEAIADHEPGERLRVEVEPGVQAPGCGRPSRRPRPQAGAARRR